MRKEKVDTVGALEFIRDSITQLASQGQVEYRGEAHKKEYLCEAVLGNPWASKSIAMSNENNWSFQKLYSALDAAWLLHERSERASQSIEIPDPSKDLVGVAWTKTSENVTKAELSFKGKVVRNTASGGIPFVSAC